MLTFKLVSNWELGGLGIDCLPQLEGNELDVPVSPLNTTACVRLIKIFFSYVSSGTTRL